MVSTNRDHFLWPEVKTMLVQYFYAIMSLSSLATIRPIAKSYHKATASIEGLSCNGLEILALSA